MDILKFPTGIDCETMALQMSLVDHEYLRAISVREFLHKNFTKVETSPNFHAMVDIQEGNLNWRLKGK